MDLELNCPVAIDELLYGDFMEMEMSNRYCEGNVMKLKIKVPSTVLFIYMSA
jgi:hypothetical protein